MICFIDSIVAGRDVDILDIFPGLQTSLQRLVIVKCAENISFVLMGGREDLSSLRIWGARFSLRASKNGNTFHSISMVFDFLPIL